MLFMFFSIRFHWGVCVCVFWNILAVETNSQQKVKTPHSFPLLYLIHSGVMFSGVRFGLIEVYGSGRSWLWTWSQKKKVKRHMVLLLFYCISFRCRLLEGFGFGFVFCLSFSCRLLEGSGCGGEFTKKNLEWMFWKVLAVKTNSQKNS